MLNQMKRLLALLLVAWVCLLQPCFATTAGPNYAGTGADDSSTGSASWTNPSNGTTSNNSYATCSLSGAGISHYLKLTNFGFSIPSGATINGITVEIERKSNSNASSISVIDNHVYIVQGGTIQTAQDKADTVTLWPLSDTFAAYGGSGDLWGLTWTYSDINASTFGVVISCKPSGLASRTASVDSVRITIDYTASGVSSRQTLTLTGIGN